MKPSSQPPFERVGRYELLGHLATGGMAELHLARATGLQGFEKIVVVKRISASLAKQADNVQLFLDEARLAASLHHPNIAQVFDVGLWGEDYFFAMEFVHGQDLARIIEAAKRSQRSLPLAQAISIVLGVAAGLHHAHAKVGYDGRALGIVHRDVSPSNVLVAYDGSIKLVDFGIAKAAIQSHKTTSGGLRGKVHYMSPEQCLQEPLDCRSDVFALAILLFEITTGTQLFEGESEFQVMKKVVEGSIPRPSERMAGYPPELERICLRGLERDRDQRYASAQALQLDLEAFAREEKLATSPVALSLFMEELFADPLASWRAAQEEGKALVEHLTEGGASLRPSRMTEGMTAPDSSEAVLTRRRRRPVRWIHVLGGALAGGIIVLSAMATRSHPGKPAATDLPRLPADAKTRPAPAATVSPLDAPAPAPMAQLAAPPPPVPPPKVQRERAHRQRPRHHFGQKPGAATTPPASASSFDTEAPLLPREN